MIIIMFLYSCNKVNVKGNLFIRAGGLNSNSVYSIYNFADNSLYCLDIGSLDIKTEKLGSPRVNIDSSKKIAFILVAYYNSSTIYELSLTENKIINKYDFETSIDSIQILNDHILYKDGNSIYTFDNEKKSILFYELSRLDNFFYFSSKTTLITINYSEKGRTNLIINNLNDDTKKTIENVTLVSFSAKFNKIIYKNVFDNKIEIYDVKEEKIIKTGLNAKLDVGYELVSHNAFIVAQKSLEFINDFEIVYDPYDFYSVVYINYETKIKKRLFTKRMVGVELDYLDNDLSNLKVMIKE